MVQQKLTKKEKVNEKELSSNMKFTILAIILIAVFSFALTPITFQNDTYYTIKIGEHIQNYGVDMEDPFSWHENLSYTYPHWLYDLLTYWIYSFFNMQGIYIVTCILSIILGISIYMVNTKLTKNQILSFLITIGVMYLLKSYITARAQLVTFILFIWTVYFIEKFIETRKIRYAIGLVLISLAIANLHVAVWPFYFVLYLPYIAEYLIAILGEFVFYQKGQIFVLEKRCKHIKKKIGKIAEPKKQKLQIKLEKLESKLENYKNTSDRIKIKREQYNENPYKIKLTKNNNVKWLIIVFIICIFTGLCTPIGDTPYTYLFKTMAGNTTQNINEHLPMTLIEQIPVIITLIIFLSILIFTKAKIKLCDLFMISGLLLLMLYSRRQLTMFALMGSIVLNRLLNDMFSRYDMDIKDKVKFFVKPVGLIITISVVAIMSIHFYKPKIGDPYVDETQYPVQASDYILANIDLKTARLYNEYNYGSYLLFRGIPVFIDSRADLYSPEFNGLSDDIFMDFINTSSIGTFYEDTFEKYGITHVICFKNSKMNMIIEKTNDSHYHLLYSDDYFVVYERLTDKIETQEETQTETQTEIETQTQTANLTETT